MVKTLRITSVLVVILAGVLLAFPAVFGGRRDPDAERILNSPSVVEQFQKDRGSRDQNSQSKISPLVKQAEAFSLYLNPPAKPNLPAVSGNRQPLATPRPERSSAKFPLVGTSYYPSEPEKSLAFINEPGKGLRWVRQGSVVGHLVIEQVNDGSVVIRDGTRTYELPMQERTGQVNLLEGQASVSGPRLSDAPLVSSQMTQVATRRGTFAARSPRVVQAAPAAPQLSSEETEALGELVERLRVLQKGLKSEKTDSGLDPAEQTALISKLISDFKSGRVGPGEPGQAGSTGQEQKTAEGNRDPNRERLNKMIKRFGLPLPPTEKK